MPWDSLSPDLLFSAFARIYGLPPACKRERERERKRRVLPSNNKEEKEIPKEPLPLIFAHIFF
jgi:hypothetical protein